VAELLYPMPYREVLIAGARAAAVDPMLVAGVIRQESLFDPAARSVADARGLMQVLPSVGEQLARRAGLPEWDPVLLYQPDVNIDFGIEHLAEALEQLQWPERALAAYNAGAARVARWQAIRGVTEDPEVFVERIPFTETRDYVRKVLRNFAIYTALYRAPAA
jgi:soluble lytic murein transglycosylase